MVVVSSSAWIIVPRPRPTSPAWLSKDPRHAVRGQVSGPSTLQTPVAAVTRGLGGALVRIKRLGSVNVESELDGMHHQQTEENEHKLGSCLVEFFSPPSERWSPAPVPSILDEN